jgi:hypothetical protein
MTATLRMVKWLINSIATGIMLILISCRCTVSHGSVKCDSAKQSVEEGYESQLERLI